VHLEVRIALQTIDWDQRRSIARRETLLGTTIASHFPRRANQLRKMFGAGAGPERAT
jgi:hypothetical protein